MYIDWKTIRPYHHSQNNAFEELVCQLARHEKNNSYKRFVRNGIPDAGAECFWELEDGSEHVWQAKYVFDMDRALPQINKSYKTALETHPRMCKFVVALPFDLPDPRYKKTETRIHGAWEKWNDKVMIWEKEAKRQGKDIKFELWTASDLCEKMISPENEGMRYYWFHGKEFTSEWFQGMLKAALTDSGFEYDSGSEVPINMDRKIECLRHTQSVYSNIQEERAAWIQQGKRYIESIPDQYDGKRQKLGELIECISERMVLERYGEMLSSPFEEILSGLKIIEELEGEQRDYVQLDLDTKRSAFHDQINRLKRLLEEEWVFLNGQAVLFYGNSKAGALLLYDICRALMGKGIPAVLILGRYFTNTTNPREQIRQLFQSHLNYSGILGVLNTIGESKGERVLIAIDALDEGEGSRIWPEFLGGMLEELKGFPWVGFLAGIRREHMEKILPAGYEKYMLKVPYPESGGDADQTGRKANVSRKDKILVPGLFMIDHEAAEAFQMPMDSPVIRSYRRISTNIEYILCAVCSGMTIECRLESGVATLVDSVKNKVEKGGQAIFLLGYGGIGKSTALVQTAVRLCDSGKNIYLFQLGRSNDQKIIHEVLERIDRLQDQDHILFIDNPYDNGEAVKELLSEIQYETNVQVVMAERLGRFDSIVEDILPDLYFNSARIIVPVLGNEKINITKFDRSQILRLQISREWKQEVVLHMFQSISNVDMLEVRSIITGKNEMSIIEWYLRSCIEYNKRVDTENMLATRCKIDLDWDEWEALFSKPNPQISKEEAKEIQGLFQVIAALDIFKIKASTKLLAQQSKIDEMRLDYILRSTLSTASSEPAIYENSGEYPYVALKHDMISTLYFEVKDISPQLTLEHIVGVLGNDKETVVRFEKQVFKRRYIQYGQKGPFNIDAKRLYRLFENNPSYYEILKERDRTYSFDVAGVWQQNERENEAAVSEMWGCILHKYESADPRINHKVVMCCLDDCQRRKIPLPKTLPITEKMEADVELAIVKNDMPGIAAAWKEKLSKLYECEISIQTLVFQWKKVIFDYLLYPFEMPEEFFEIAACEEYQVVDAAYAALEDYVRRNRLDKLRYYELGARLYKAIASHQSKDISSRMRLAHCYVQNKDYRQAERMYQDILIIDPDSIAANIALGNLCARLLKDAGKELKDNELERQRLMMVCEFKLKRAIELAEKAEDKSICYGAMGWFLFRTMKKYQESYDAFQTALQYCDQASIHSQMGMLCGYFDNNNERFSIKEAKWHYERAISLLKKTSLNLLSVYMPYAKLHYCLGEYDEAVRLYEKSERLGEQKANEMLQRIQQEREELARLRAWPLKTMTTLEMVFDLTNKNRAVFVDEEQKNEIFSILLNSMADTNKTNYDIKMAADIVLNLQRFHRGHVHDTIANRVMQQVEAAAIEHDIRKKKAEEYFRLQCFFIGRTT